MSAPHPAPMSREAFLAWDATQQGRHEFDGQGPVAMVGGTHEHSTVTGNLFAVLWQGLRGHPCRPVLGDMRIDTGRTYRYADVAVTCTPARTGDLFIREPVIVFEVLSSSTALTDLTLKNLEYRSLPSIRRFVALDQQRPVATMYVRVGEEWVGRLLEGGEAVLDMPEIGMRLRLQDLYDGVAEAAE